MERMSHDRGTRWTIKHMTELVLEAHPGLERDSVERPWPNTLHFHAGGVEWWRFWETDIAALHPDGSLVLRSGGHRGLTTADRINRVLRSRGVSRREAGVWSDRRIWRIKWHGETYGFAEGMRLYPDGRVEGAVDQEKEQRRHARMNAEIKKYVAAVAKRLEREWPMPDAGDCFYCAMRTKEGRALGEAMGDTEHLRSHMDEAYVHGSLLVNAVADRGSPDPMRQYQLRHAMKDSRFVCDCVTKYLRKRLFAPRERMEQNGREQEGT